MRFVGAVWCVAALAFSAAGRTASAAPSPPPASPPPAAASESRLAEAKQHYAAASKFYDLAEYEAALREFKEAYRAVEDPAFLFNIAQCHRRLGQKQDAITFYKNYLRRAPHAANKAEVERRIAELERAPAASPPPPDEPTTPVAPLVLDLPPPAAPAKDRPADATLVAAPSPAPPPEETPFYKRGWFWIVTGAVVAGAAATVIVLYSRSETGPFCPDCAGTTVIAP
jgi:tetratricopeptide (TPR) repeat protein